MTRPTATADYDYALPEAAIAQQPIEPRDAARLLDATGPDDPVDRSVRDLPDLLGPGDVLVVNDTRVLPARLHLRKSTGGRAEVLLLRPVGDDRWEALVRPGRRLPAGTVLSGDDDTAVVEVGEAVGDVRIVRVLAEPWAHGQIPLPPYIHQPLRDPERYQTVYAAHPGSVAAPTAGLHLTTAVLDACRARGVGIATVELAVGLDTFRPITVDDPQDHVIHEEAYRVPASTWDACRTAARVVAVGTTTVRALEAAAATGRLEGRTDLYIRAGFEFEVVDVLMTNFHLPRSTLLLMIEAFMGPRWRTLYRAALDRGYRFLSFGDAMLVAAGVKLEITARDGAARATTVTTGRGSYRTPIFMPVGTRGAVRTLSSADLDTLGAEIVLGNTYHLMLRPGADLIERLGGLHRFEGWDGHILTDSGGFQVFSLEPKVDDEGVVFRSTYDGSLHRFTPEAAVAVQGQLGSDIAMVLDICPALPAPAEVVRLAAERTLVWAARAREAHRGGDQAQFGIVQGGADPDLRAECAQRTAALEFDGYGIGGLSVGEPRPEMLAALAPAVAELPTDRPRYLMGVGDPVGLIEAVALGVDQFDCVQPTRLGRHGTALTGAGRVHLRNAASFADDGPLDPDCACAVCARWSRAYLRHLVMVAEPTAARLLTLHNLAWMFALMDRIRAAVVAGTLAALRSEVAAVWA